MLAAVAAAAAATAVATQSGDVDTNDNFYYNVNESRRNQFEIRKSHKILKEENFDRKRPRFHN